MHSNLIKNVIFQLNRTQSGNKNEKRSNSYLLRLEQAKVDLRASDIPEHLLKI